MVPGSRTSGDHDDDNDDDDDGNNDDKVKEKPEKIQSIKVIGWPAHEDVMHSRL